MYPQITALLLSLLLPLSGCSSQSAPEQVPSEPNQVVSEPVNHKNLSGTVPNELEAELLLLHLIPMAR